MIKEDRTQHSSAAGARPLRLGTTTILLHRFATHERPTGFDDAVRFFVRDPEGIATVALGGTYAEKVPTIEAWRAAGVPAAYEHSGFVPYHFLVDAQGRVARMLPLEARGAHASAFNWRSVAVACLGNFEEETPTAAQVDACVELVADLLVTYPAAKVISHDEANVILSLPPKGCAGRLFPLEEIRTRARAAALARMGR